jgi:dienelactone hydrolase
VVFHHGINGSRYQMLPVADQLAEKGFVVVAADAPFHGDRAFCDADTDCNGGTCTLAPTNFKAPGTCTGGSGLAFDPTRLSTKAAGNYFISENFFRIRDAIREDLLDQSALVLAAARFPSVATDPLTAALGAEGVVVDPTKVYFAGLSLGGMIGTSLVATNPRISRAALNVTGGTLTDVFTTAPAFQTDILTLFAKLIPGFTPAKVDPTNAAYDPAVAQAYAQTLIVAKWILDPADPVNYAADLTNKDAANATLKAALGPLAVTSTAAYGQLVQGDLVVPNALSRLLYLDAAFPAGIPSANYIPPAGLTPGLLHGLLLLPPVVPGGTQGQLIRQDLADFLATPGSPHTGDVTLP